MIVALDPGTEWTGWARLRFDVAAEGWELVGAGVWRFPRRKAQMGLREADDLARRTRALAARLGELIAVAGVQALAAEEQSLPPGVRAANKMGWTHGAIAAAAEAGGLPLVYVPVGAVKEAVAGARAASKAAVAAGVRAMLGGPALAEAEVLVCREAGARRLEHMHDACAVGLAAARSDVGRWVAAAARGGHHGA